MKKILFLYILIGMILCTSCSNILDDDFDISIKNASATEIYFFHLSTCPYSNSAKAYITKEYPLLKIRYIDTSTSDEIYLLDVASKEYQLGKSIHTPLICLGNDCIQGWDMEKREWFDILVERYLPSP